jgi:hypothetical protein
MNCIASVSTSIALLAMSAHADVINVPDDYTTIQTAIDAAEEGDEIVVQPGIYHEAINLQGKAIHLRSNDGPETAVIDASGLFTSVVTCTSAEEAGTIIEGFTITGGSVVDEAGRGGGILSIGSSPTVTNCVITGNSVHGFGHSEPSSGGGIHHEVGSMTLSNCVISDNSAFGDLSASGGGMRIVYANPTITNCQFIGNSTSAGPAASTGYGWGGAIAIVGSHPVFGDPQFSNCTFLNNVAEGYSVGLGGGVLNDGGHPMIVNCSFASNSALQEFTWPRWAAGGSIHTTDGSPGVMITGTSFCGSVPNHINGPWTDIGANCFASVCIDCNDNGIPDECDIASGSSLDIDSNGIPDECEALPCPWDTTGDLGEPDDTVGTADFFALLQNWGPCPAQPEPCSWDTTGNAGDPDATVGTSDFFDLLQHWGPCE